MNTKFKNMNMLEKYIGLVPDIVLEDVDNRISDWFYMGGEIEDNYIKQQYKYLERYLELKTNLK